MSLGTLGNKVLGKVLGKGAAKNKKKATEAVNSVRGRAAKLVNAEDGKVFSVMGKDNVQKEKNLNQFKGAGKLAAVAFGGVAAYEALSSKDKKSFDTAFANARRNEEKTFTWRGDLYNTKLQRNSKEIKKAESRVSKDKPKPPTKLNKGGMVTKSRTGNMDYRQGGLILSSVDNRKKKK
jgi:16S rRNA G966 N2-methylase RsmD